jgi:hypothetical protein
MAGSEGRSREAPIRSAAAHCQLERGGLRRLGWLWGQRNGLSDCIAQFVGGVLTGEQQFERAGCLFASGTTRDIPRRRVRHR